MPDDIDCTTDVWSGRHACTAAYCAAQAHAESRANAAMSIPYLISAISSPFLGFAVDRFGGRALIAAVCPVLLISAHLVLAFDASSPPTLPLVAQGIAYSVFGAALWPSVPLTVPARFEGLAFGLVTAVQNGGLFAFPLLVARVYAATGSRYIPSTELLFVGFASLGLLAGLALSVYDATHGHTLNRPALAPSPQSPSDGTSVTPLDAQRGRHSATTDSNSSARLVAEGYTNAD